MIKNYLRIIVRQFVDKPIYFAINAFGLTIGFACCLMIYFYVMHELSFDRYHRHLDRLYRINYDVNMNGSRVISPSVPAFVAPQVMQLFPEVEKVVRFIPSFGSVAVKANDQTLFDETGVIWADPTFYEVLDFQIVQGYSNSLSRPFTMVISKRIAIKYFGTSDPIGRTLLLNGHQSYEVVAVMDNVPDNSHLRFDMVCSFSSLTVDETTISWNNPNYITFLLVHPDVNINHLQEKIDNWVNPEKKEQPSENGIALQLEPLKEVHFNTQVFNYGGYLSITDKQYIYLFCIIAGVVLMIACINYINLATARAIMRAKEVGIRKTTGASFGQLVVQFLFESAIYLLPAVVLAILFVTLFMPVLNDVLGKTIHINWLNSGLLRILILGWLSIAIMAGIYPALVLSSYKPLHALKQGPAVGPGYALRKGLVICQFTISSLLLVSTLVVYSQLTFMQRKNLGLDHHRIIQINGNRDLKESLKAYIDHIGALEDVESVTASWGSPFSTVIGYGLDLTPDDQTDSWTMVGAICGDEHYLATLGMKLHSGRTFDVSKSKDTINEFIVNKSFLNEFGISPEQAIGMKLNLGIVSHRGPGTVVGVVNDFHFSSLHESVKPVVLFNHIPFQNGVMIRYREQANVSNLLQVLEEQWKQVVPDRPFNYTFLDDQYTALYRSEQRTTVLISTFSFIAIVVAALGLFGLSTFTSLQRAKEISIRKVLGATFSNIIILINRGYLRLLFISFVITLPLSFWAMTAWLENFAYRISISAWHYVLAFGLVLLVSSITVAFQSIKVSVVNPVRYLRGN